MSKSPRHPPRAPRVKARRKRQDDLPETDWMAYWQSVPPSQRPRDAVHSLPGAWTYYRQWSSLRWFLLLLLPLIAATAFVIWTTGDWTATILLIVGSGALHALFAELCTGYSASNWGLYFRKTEPVSYWLGITPWLLGYTAISVLPYCNMGPESVEVRPEERLSVDGVPRSYRLVIPHKREQPAPVVIALHGIGDTPEAMAGYSKLDRLAGKHGFVLAYPAAQSSMWRTEADVNDPDKNADVRFFDALLARLEREQAIDSRRVYVLGMSNGATFAHLLAAARPNKIAALVVHSGVRPRELERTLHPMPILFIVGDQDTEFSGVRANAQDYFAQSDKGELLTVPGLGHTWSAKHNEQMWRFLSQFRTIARP